LKPIESRQQQQQQQEKQPQQRRTETRLVASIRGELDAGNFSYYEVKIKQSLIHNKNWFYQFDIYK
jgi:hypothetical protein